MTMISSLEGFQLFFFIVFIFSENG